MRKAAFDSMRTLGLSIWLILGIALVLRVAIVLTTDYHLASDAIQYNRYASSIAKGDGYPESPIAQGGGPTAFFPPLYPLELGSIYWLTGDSVTAGRLMQALLGTAAVALIGVATWQLWGRRFSITAMGVAAIYPPLLGTSVSLFSEPLFIVFVLAAVVATLAHRTSPHPLRWAVGAGVLTGLATLTRANGIVLLLPLAIGVWNLVPRFSLQSLSQPAAFTLAAVVTIAPWSVRNMIELDSFVPLTTQADLALARNYNAVALNDPTYPSAPHQTAKLTALARRADLSEAQIADRAGRMGREFIGNHPGYVVETVLRNTVRALLLGARGVQIARNNTTNEGFPRWLADAAIFSFYLLASLALVGACLPAARQAPWWFWAVALLLWLSVAWLSAGRMRYRVPVDPFIIMLSSIALVAGWQSLLSRLGLQPAKTE